MDFHVMTLFPEMIEQSMSSSITGRGLRQGIISLHCYNIRAYSKEKHGKVDDYSYGGGAGMLIQADPVYDCYRDLASKIPAAHRKRVIYVTPQGRTFRQEMAEDLSQYDDLVFLCGHYEGVDERVLEEIVTDYISIGDYVLTGGELPALVMMDTISRLLDGVLGNESSAEIESFHGKLLEYPQYTRPEVWRGKKVPEVLLSGNAVQIENWRREASVARTRERREDLYQDYLDLAEIEKILLPFKREYADLLNLVKSGYGELVDRDGPRILLEDRRDHCSYFASPSTDLREAEPHETEREGLLFLKQSLAKSGGKDPDVTRRIIFHDVNEEDLVREILGPGEIRRVRTLVYTPRERPGRARTRTLQERLSLHGRPDPDLISFIDEGIIRGLEEGTSPLYYLPVEAALDEEALEQFGLYAARGEVLIYDRRN